MSSPPIFDPAAIERLKATLGEEASILLPELIGEYLADLPNLVEQASTALDEQRTDDLRRLAHNMKSSSLTFGAMALAEAARLLELAAKEGTANPGLLAAVDAELPAARAALESAVEDLS